MAVKQASKKNDTIRDQEQKTTHRSPWDPAGVAGEIADLILEGKVDPRLQWRSAQIVKLRVEEIIQRYTQKLWIGSEIKNGVSSGFELRV